MTDGFIADTSVAIGWVHEPQETADTDAMLDAMEGGATLEVPALWPLEVANTVAVLVRRGRMTEGDRQIALGWLRGLRLRVDHETAGLAFTRLSELATTYSLTIYDASYLELAQRRQLVLGCRDGPLRRAALKAGVKLWG